MEFLVFTDLDGTLLDHHDYSWDDASEALAEINRRNIPLIFTTSKTRAELLPLRRILNNKWPFITENGGAIFFPNDTWPYQVNNTIQIDEYKALIIGHQYASIRTVFKQLQSQFPIRGFGDMTVHEIVWLTNLFHIEAEVAKQREFSEPFLLKNPDQLSSLAQAASEHDCTVVKGGRFHHLMSINQNKGTAVAQLISIFNSQFGKYTTIGLGDSDNDLSMLDHVDIPVLIAKPDGSLEDYSAEGLICSRYSGSKGWGECVMEILDLETKES